MKSFFVSLAFLLSMPENFCFGSQNFIEDSINMEAVWVPDNGDGTYTNPILFADYSDPDIIQVEDDFYMVSSSFNCIPGIPVLHSSDLVNWEIIGSVLTKQPPFEVYEKPGHGVGVWAPSIRYRKGEFYVYYGDPDHGIYVAKTTDPAGTWNHKLLQKAYGWIDPCPFWDDNDSAYLVHAYAKSRTGYNSMLTLRRMSQDGETLYPNDSIMLFDGNDPAHPRKTIEGPKMYKRNGFYYVFAPFNGVANGSQAVLRADTIIGPYEDKTVLERGSTNINGPHQGGWVELKSGESWFMHFQEIVPYGRIVHLQPVEWINDWPFMGEDFDGNGIGEPVKSHAKPNVGQTYPIINPQTSDKFNSEKLGLQWQWHSNFDSSWYSLSDKPGTLRLFATDLPSTYKNMWDVGSMVMQKLPAEKFSIQTKLNLNLQPGETAGLIVMGNAYSYIGITKTADGLIVSQKQCSNASSGSAETEISSSIFSITDTALYLGASVEPGAACSFGYSLDGITYNKIGSRFNADEGKWIGAKIGLFCRRPASNTGNKGYADFEWFNVERIFTEAPKTVSNPTPKDGESVEYDSRIQLSWEGLFLTTESFDIYVDTVPNPSTLIRNIKTTSYTATKIQPDKTYYWRVDAKNELGTTMGPVWSFIIEEDINTNISNKFQEYTIQPIYPNPVAEVLYLSINSQRITNADIRILDIIGNGVFYETIPLNMNSNQLQLNLKQLSSGIYFLYVSVDGFKKSIKFIKD